MKKKNNYWETAPLNEVMMRVRFADWYYLRSGETCDTQRGEKAWEAFKAGRMVRLRGTNIKAINACIEMMTHGFPRFLK